MTPGETFTEARQQCGLSLEELATRTKIRVERLIAIEHMDAEHLPDVFYVRGYVRTMATELGLDPVAVTERYIAAFREQSPSAKIAAPEPSSTRRVMTEEGRAIAQLVEGKSQDEAPAVMPEVIRLAASSPMVLAALITATGITLATGFWMLAGSNSGGGSRVARRVAANTVKEPSARSALDAATQPVATTGESDAVTTPMTIPPADFAPVPRRASKPHATVPSMRSRPKVVRPHSATPTGTLAAQAGEPATIVAPEAATPIASPPPEADPNTRLEPSANPEMPTGELSGSWMLINQIEQSNVTAFHDLTLGFRLELNQDGNRVRGHGFKWTENGRPVPGTGQTPISVDGTVEGNRLALTFTERGARRTSRGSFKMQVAEDGSLRGSFSSDVARSSGRARAVRMP